MLRSWRWPVVAAGTAALALVPALTAALPARSSTLTAEQLLRAVQRSAAVAYSGYAESSGVLSLPVSNQFTDQADLFGGRTRMRVWWRGERDWRVDTVSLTGETDVHRTGADLWTWDYEDATATLTILTDEPRVRLPAAGDLLPTTLARRLLSQGRPDEVERLPSRRVAGHDAAGLRLRPNDPHSTIERVDVWVDPASGAALRVDVAGAGRRVVSTQFLDFTTRRPPAADTEFVPPEGARLRSRTDVDLAALIDRVAGIDPPASLAGIARNPGLSRFGAIGVYGRGVTEFAVSPLFGRTARALRDQLAKTPGVTTDPVGQTTSIGPLTILLTPSGTGGPLADVGWLLVGTVTEDVLAEAAVELPFALGRR